MLYTIFVAPMMNFSNPSILSSKPNDTVFLALLPSCPDISVESLLTQVGGLVFPCSYLLCFLDRARWMQITVFFGSRALDANPLLLAKPPDGVRSAVTDRPRRVLEMDFGARDEAIGQELTEGGGFSDPAMVSV